MNLNVLSPCTLLLWKVGSYNREFAKRWAKELEKALGRDGERLDPAKVKSVLDKGRHPCRLVG